jgi:hypothetical protein
VAFDEFWEGGSADNFRSPRCTTGEVGDGRITFAFVLDFLLQTEDPIKGAVVE